MLCGWGRTIKENAKVLKELEKLAKKSQKFRENKKRMEKELKALKTPNEPKPKGYPFKEGSKKAALNADKVKKYEEAKKEADAKEDYKVKRCVGHSNPVYC